MNFRDVNGQIYLKNNHSEKNLSYNGRYSFRDMNSTKNTKEKIQTENTVVPEQKTVNITDNINISQQNQSMYSQQMNFPQNQSMYSQQMNFPQNQSMYSQQMNFPQNQSMYSQQMNFSQNQNVYQRQNNIPVAPEKTQDKFLYYTNNNNSNNNIPVPPPLPKPDPPQPPKPETPTPTPPPKMVKAKQPVVKKIDDFSMDFGAFGGTFDGNPDQSTPIADIPVMNSIDDYKL